MQTQAHVVQIDKWEVVKGSAFWLALPPETERGSLHGLVTGHMRVSDGESATTSTMLRTDGTYVYTKSGTAYLLGEPDEVYESRFPDAKARLLAALPRAGQL